MMALETWWKEQRWLQSDWFFAIAAQATSAYPKIKQLFEDLYHADKFRFYHKAQSSSAYTHILMSKGSLSSEVTAKRNMGILAANDDQDLRSTIVNCICNSIPKLRDYLKRPDENVLFISSTLNGSLPPFVPESQRTAALYLSAYAIAHTWREDSLRSPICDVLRIAIEQMEAREKELFKPRVYENAELFDMFAFSKEDWKFIRDFKDSSVIMTFRENWDVRGSIPDILDNYSDADEKEKVYAVSNSMWSQLLRQDLHWANLFPMEPLTREDKRNILSGCQTMDGIKGGVRPHHFVAAYFVHMLAKELRSTREFYWCNNAETQFLETERLIEENSQLKSEIRVLKDTCYRLQKEVQLAEKSRREEIHSAILPYQEGLRQLEEQVGVLTKKLNEATKRYEETAFLGEQISTEDEPPVSLEDVLAGRRLLIVGGHTVWRKKLQQSISYITVVDGVTTTLDLKQLDHTDLLVFYTYNMAHKAFERIISYVKQKGIPYAYLPRITNVDRIERELANLLLELDKLRKS